MKLKLVFNLLFSVLLVWAVIRIVKPRQSHNDSFSHVLTARFLENVTRLSISQGDFSVDLEQRNGGWEIRKPIIGAADRSVVLRVLSLLEAAKPEEVISKKEIRKRELTVASYGLEKPRAIITLGDATSSRQIWFGDDAPLGSRVYVKLSGSDNILAIGKDVFAGLPDTLTKIRDPMAFRGDVTRTHQVEISCREKPFIKLTRTTGDWQLQQPIAATADSHNVDAVLRTLYDIHVRRFISDPVPGPDTTTASTNPATAALLAYGLTPDEASAKVDVISGTTSGRGILFGKPAADVADEVYAKLTTSDTIFTVPKASLDGILVDLDDLRSRTLFSITPRQAIFLRLQLGNQRLLLTRSEAGLWNLTEPMQWPADQQIVADMLTQITALKINFFMDHAANVSPKSLGLEPPACIIQIGQTMDELDENVVNRLFLSQPEPGDDTLNVKRASDPEAFRVLRAAAQAITQHAKDPFYFADRVMLSVAPDTIQSITMSSDGDPDMSFQKSEHGTWASDAHPDWRMNPTALDAVLFHVANLRADRIEGLMPSDLEPSGLQRPSAILTLGLAGSNGIQRSVLIGKPVDSTHSAYFATVRGQDILFRLSRDTVSALTTSLVETVSASLAH